MSRAFAHGALRAAVLGLALTCSPAPAQQEDGIATETLLSDRDFFRLATCGAPPGGVCAGPTLRWPKRLVTVAVLHGDTVAPEGFPEQLDTALNDAISEINRAGSGLRIRRDDTAGPDADIRLRPTPLSNGDALSDVPGLSAAGVMGVGYMTFWWNSREEITEASILISTSIIAEDMASVVLEELFQTLGPRFDIDGPAYEGVSILSQTSNVTVRITGQDARLLRWLYPLRP